VPAGRVVWEGAAPSGSTPRGFAFSGIHVEAEAAYLAAADDQQIADGGEVVLDDTSFAGPVTLRSRAKVVDVTMNGRLGVAFKDRFRLEGLLGMEMTNVDLQVNGGGAQASDATLGVGLVIGARAGFQAHDLVDLYGQTTFGVLGSSHGRNNGMLVRKLEAGARILPFEGIGLFAAYRWTEIRQERDPGDSDGTLQMRGPVIGLELGF
jgi:hypothetical protein